MMKTLTNPQAVYRYDILIDIQRGHSRALAWFASVADVPSVPGLAVMELIQNAQNSHQVRQALKLVAPLPIVWPTEVDCRKNAYS